MLIQNLRIYSVDIKALPAWPIDKPKILSQTENENNVNYMIFLCRDIIYKLKVIFLASEVVWP